LITPGEVRVKAERRYPDFLSGLVRGESLFPLEIPFAKAKSGEAAARWNELDAELSALREASGERRPGRSFGLEWEERRDRLAGRRLFPSRIYFPDEDSFLAFIGKAREAERFRADLGLILGAFPELRAWAEARPAAIVEQAGDWPRILAALAWFKANPASGLYLREVPAVEDTKFIEAHKRVIGELLDLVEPRPDAGTAKPAKPESFEARCGLKLAQPLVRIRILDRDIALRRFSGLEDLSLPADSLASLDFPEIRRVLVVENKASFGKAEVFLTAPQMAGTMAIWGSGYAARSLEQAPWLSSRRLGYWGDIDSHGLRILGAFRASFPEAEALLMDEATFDRFPEYRSDAPADDSSEPDGLSPEELSLFRRLVSLPSRNRLEQERIPLGYASAVLRRWVE
jgi:hypothetical protein